MGAGAGKQYTSDKTRHAENVYEAVRAYEAAHPHDFTHDYGHLQPFKTRVQMAAVEAKRKGKDIDSSLAQLNDADLETLRKFVEDTWRQKEEDRKRKNENDAAMTVEEFVEEDPNLNDNAQDNIDETTSVLSYGDGEEPGGEGDSDGEIDSSHSLLLGKSKSRDDDDEKLESSGEIVEDLELQNDNSVDHGRNAAVKIFPMDVATDMAGIGYTTPNRKGPRPVPANNRAEESKEMGIADALAKFWEIDEVGSITSQLDLGIAESPRNGSFSPFSPDLRSSRRSLESVQTKERNKRLDERNERLMGLQRQKVMSYTENAKLEREVEELQRQLEIMDELDRAAGIQHSSSSTNVHSTPVRLHNSMQSSASTIYNSANNTPIQSSTNSQSGSHSTQRGGHHAAHQPSKLSYIYPIDEETNDWSNSLMGTPDAKIIQQQQRAAYYGNGRHNKDKKSMASSSSSDEENVPSSNPVQGGSNPAGHHRGHHVHHGHQRHNKNPSSSSSVTNTPVGPNAAGKMANPSNNFSTPIAPSSGSLVAGNSSNSGGNNKVSRRSRSEDKANPSPSNLGGNSNSATPTAAGAAGNASFAYADGKINNSNSTPAQEKGAPSDSSAGKNRSIFGGGRRARYRSGSNGNNTGDDSDDSASNGNNSNKPLYFTPSNGPLNKFAAANGGVGGGGGERDNSVRRANGNNNSNNGVASNYASDSDTNVSSQIAPLSARGAGGKSISTSNIPSSGANNSGGKKPHGGNGSGSGNAGVSGPKMAQAAANLLASGSASNTSSAIALDNLMAPGNSHQSSPGNTHSYSPTKKHADARRARNTIQTTENDHKLSPSHPTAHNGDGSGGNGAGSNISLNNKHHFRRHRDAKDNNASEDETSSVATNNNKAPSKNTALKRLNKRYAPPLRFSLLCPLHHQRWTHDAFECQQAALG